MPQRDPLIPLPGPNLLLCSKPTSLPPLPLALPLPIPRERLKRHRPRRSRALQTPTRAGRRRDLTHLPRPRSLLVLIAQLRRSGSAERARGVEREER